MTSASELLIIGGGMAGASVAWFAREAGMAVTLVDAGGPVESTTWASGGMLAPRAEGLADDELAQGLAALDVHKDWLPAVEQAGGMPVHRGFGLARLGAPGSADDEAIALYPGLAHLRDRATWSTDEGWVDPRGLLITLRAALRRRGVHVVQATARAINLTGPAPELDLGDVQLTADRIVVAAGHTADRLAGLPWHAIGDIRGDRGVLVHVAGIEPPPGVLFEFDGRAATYVVPDPQGVRIGSTSDTIDRRPHADPREIGELMLRAERLWPLGGGVISGVTVGFRPLGPLPDAMPFCGPLDRVGRVWGLLGLHRNGILLGPLLARDLIAQIGSRQG
jgi:glycine/D-amino acid oxidase-like deaminating enzyme